MATPKKPKEQFIKLSPPGLPTRLVTIKLNITANEKPEWQINPDLYIINMNTAAKCTQEVIMGDRIVIINGNYPKTAADAMASLMPGCGAVKLAVERRQNAVPVPVERMKLIGATRLEGFSYCLVNCVNTGKQAKATLGFTLSLLKTKAHIVTVEAGSIASQHFAVGDALLDVDGEKIPFADVNFLKNFSQKYFKDGRFSVVVERPTTPQRIDQYTMIYKMMLPQSDADIEMGADATKIGMEASAMHGLVFKKVKPKSALTSTKVNSVQATQTQTVDETEKKVRMASISMVSVIGSDVDDEDDLRKVERKSHSKEQMNLDDL